MGFHGCATDNTEGLTAGAIRRIFKQAFERVGLPNFNPHSFRHTLAVQGEKPEEWKAYSQNFGHSSPMTTFNSYGPVAPHRQAEILNAGRRRGLIACPRWQPNW
jgi:integrase